MARRWCYFEFETEEELDRWTDIILSVLEAYEERMNYGSSGRTWDEIEVLAKKDQYYRDLLGLEGFIEEADVGQKVVLNRRQYALAKRLGLLPRRIHSFADCEEGIPGGSFEGPGREIVPGVSESTNILFGMTRKGEQRPRIELSRADIEGGIHRIDEEE